MNIERLEKRVNKQYGTITYWEDGVLIGRKCTVCGKDKKMSEFSYKNKKKGTYKANCKECDEQYRKKNATHLKELSKQYYKDNIERIKKYCKDNAKHRNEINKQWREENKEKLKQYREKNKEKIAKNWQKYYEENNEKYKQYRKDNAEKTKEYDKQYYQKNKEYKKEYGKQRYETDKQNNLQKISEMIKQSNSILKELDLSVYGYIYKIENIKTGHVYIGQTTNPLKARYGSNIIQGWIKERLDKDTQKFTEELIEEDFIVTEVLDVGYCKYHLDKLESYWIDYYDSFNNGYNNCAGNHETDDGLKEFNKMLSKYNLRFENGKLIGGDHNENMDF